MADCVFCRIVNSELPSYKLYEDEEFIVILDRYPSCLGHILVIPKAHAEDIYTLGSEAAGKAFSLAAQMASILKEGLGCEGLNILQNNGPVAGQSVPHFHIHLIPRVKADGISISWNTIDPAPEKFNELMKKLEIAE